MGWQDLLKKVVNTIKENVDSELNPNKPAQPSQTVSKPAQPASKPQHEETRYEETFQRTEAQWVEYFREIIRTEFSQYTFKENVPVTELTGFVSDEFQLYRTRPRQVYKAEWGKPYTFVIYQAGVPKGIVMLGSGHSHDQNVKYLIARMYAKKMNLPYINFYTQMANERNYVIERIHNFGIR